MGYEVGTKILDVNYIREKGYKRETNLEKMLLFIKANVWRVRQESDSLCIVKYKCQRQRELSCL